MCKNIALLKFCRCISDLCWEIRNCKVLIVSPKYDFWQLLHGTLYTPPEGVISEVLFLINFENNVSGKLKIKLILKILSKVNFNSNSDLAYGNIIIFWGWLRIEGV